MKRLSGQSRTKECLFLAEFRAAIVPVEFSLREVDVYGSVLPIELLGMESATVDEQALRQLLVDCLKVLLGTCSCYSSSIRFCRPFLSSIPTRTFPSKL